ncbi:MAG TPA: hypothetical protein ACFYD3_05180 [Candidatus Hypogeohydataceae bacterium YC41]
MKIKAYLYIPIMLVFIALLMSCKREKPEEALKEEEVKQEKEFLKEELPPLEGWAQKQWEEEKEIKLETEQGLEEAMAATSLNMRRLDRGVQKKDWKVINESSRKIEDLIAGRCVNLYYKKNPAGIPTDFIVIGDQFRRAIRQLILAGDRKDINMVKLRYDEVSRTCSDCHEKFRKKT